MCRWELEVATEDVPPHTLELSQLMIIVSGTVKILLPGTSNAALPGDLGYLLTIGPGYALVPSFSI